ncbi:MAG: thioredoxin fold domain-containing protein [Desulfatitalea sp.]|nr:thioredoxin fold domain-containing protein [Desulfatitalea sp.]NNJ98917.1 thioredoxin fold domain-containing protein [Desulfatitalea sp.]
MKRSLLLILATICLIWPFGSSAAGQDAAQVKWLTYEQAQKEDPPRKFLLYFYTDWCGYCRKLESQTFADKTIVDFINENFTPVRINSEGMPKVSARYNITGVPHLRFLTAKGQDIAHWPGYIEVDKLLSLLKYIHTNSYEKMGYAEFMKKQ